MKLATALTQRADLQTKISELSVRLNNNAKVQEGEEPAERPEELLKELDSCCRQLEALIAGINLTNSKTVINGKTITELLAKRDVLAKKINTERTFLDNASERVTRYSKTEIVIKSTVDVADLQKKIDKMSKELRELDEIIQEANWTTDLL